LATSLRDLTKGFGNDQLLRANPVLSLTRLVRSFRDGLYAVSFRVSERFSATRMVKQYLAIHERLIGGEAEPLAGSHEVSVWMR
jgi:hypothetical protein